MGAIFVQKNSSGIPTRTLDVFRRKGFQDPHEIVSGSTTVFYFPKQIAEYEGIAERNGTRAVVSGTCFYHELPPQESLDRILKDIEEGTFSTSMLKGNFLLIVLKSDGEISLCTDRIGQYSAYFHNGAQILSSSFLAVLAAAGFVQRMRLNRASIAEVLLTGTGFGAETMVTDVKRLVPGNEDEIEFINVLKYSAVRSNHETDSESDIEEQIEILRSEFKIYTKLFDRTGVVTGLTGGLDSRLLLLLLRENPVRLRAFTNTYDLQAREYICAAELAQAAEVDFETYVPEKPWEMETTEYREMARDGFFFWDGIPRIHHLWIEKRKSRSHLESIYDSCTSGVSGVGGERFRIHDGMTSKRYPVESWIDNEILGACGRSALAGEKSRDFRAGFHEKIRALAGIEEKEHKVCLTKIRKFYDNVYNTSNRTFRASIENQLVFFLSPFVEPEIGILSTDLVKRYRNLEAEMINRLSPELSHVRTSYGYSPGKYASSRDFLLRTLKSRAFFGFFSFARSHLSKNSGLLNERMLARHSFHRDHLDRVRNLDLPIDVKALAANPSLFPVLIQTGMFLEEMEEYLNAD